MAAAIKSAAGGNAAGGGPASHGSANRLQLSATSWLDKFRAPLELVPPTMSLAELWKLHPPELGTVKIFGKVVQTPRYQQSYGQPYTFSGQTLFGGSVPPQLQPFLDWANSSGYGTAFNEVLVNWYCDGHHYIGAHSDDEHQLVPGEPILSISLGSSRTFRVKPRAGGGRSGAARDISMPHGTVLVMGGSMQKEFTHEVPKVAGKKGELLGRRINITIRAFKAGTASNQGAGAGGTATARSASHDHAAAGSASGSGSGSADGTVAASTGHGAAVTAEPEPAAASGEVVEPTPKRQRTEAALSSPEQP